MSRSRITALRMQRIKERLLLVGVIIVCGLIYVGVCYEYANPYHNWIINHGSE
jgi:hypothetical protein